jgi:hypothetical protein
MQLETLFISPNLTFIKKYGRITRQVSWTAT